MEKNRIILFYPKPAPRGENLVPLNLMAIARMLDPKLYEVEIINATVEKNSMHKVLNKAKEGNLLCIGVTSMTGYQIRDALRLTGQVKKHFPHIPIIWGGYHPTILPLETIKDPTVDIVVRGQGELIFRELVERFSNDFSLDDVQGIVYKTKEGKIKNNPDRPFTDLNEFPILPWHLVDTHYTIEDQRWGRMIDYYTSQGCPFNCGFCAEPAFCKRQWTGLDAERVVNEIKMLKGKYSLDAIIIRDSNFFVNKERVRKICEGLIREKLLIKLVGVNARVDTLLSYEDELWELLYSAGVRELLVGAESGSQAVLDLINKGIEVEDTLRFFAKATQHNFRVSVSLMSGLPGINHKEEFVSTLNLIDKILKKNYYGVSECYIFHYIPYPGSSLYELSKRYGFEPPLSLKGWSRMNLFYPKASWIEKECRKYVNYLSLYILRRLTNPYQPTNRIVKLAYSKFIDPVLRWRWRHRYFNFFFERYLINTFNYLGGLMARLRRQINHFKLKRRTSRVF